MQRFPQMCLQGNARLAFWCLSRQTFDAAVLDEHLSLLLNALALGLVTGNKWESIQCVSLGLKCINNLAKQIPAALQALGHIWLPLVWKLLLVQPITDYEQVHRPLETPTPCCAIETHAVT